MHPCSAVTDRLGGADVPVGGKSPEIGRCQLCSPAYRATFGPRMLATARPDLRCADGEQRTHAGHRLHQHPALEARGGKLSRVAICVG